MCTIVAIKGLSPSYPLVVAANRDEFYERPATPPRVVHAHPRVVAGVDERSGGTWMGANARGVFVALTNQRQHHPPEGRSTSRGTVVLEALRQETVEGVDAVLEALDARDYASFNLFYGDAHTLRVAYARDDRPAVEIETLEDGLFVLPNDRIGSAEFPKTRRAVYLVEPLVEAPWPELLAGLEEALGDHEEPPIEAVPVPPEGAMFDRATLLRLQALCIHTPVYGTRSATVLALSPGHVAHYLFANGSPCTNPFSEVTELFR
jgi:uncharacterized protein with NRDE domain